jgi:hypothetical protein
VRVGVLKAAMYRDTYVGTHTIQLEKATEPAEKPWFPQPAAYLRSGDEVFHNISITCENCSSTSNLKLL